MSKVSMIFSVISAHKKMAFRVAQLGVRNISMSNFLRKTHYDVLGVPRDATQADIKNAYFELSKIYHPDRIAATDENIAKFREVSAAYEILGNEQSRKLYDRGLIADLKKPGDEEITDPIIKFYQQRQEFSRAQAKGADELDAWTQTYFKKLRASTMKHDLFARSKRANVDHLFNPNRLLLHIGILISMSVVGCSWFNDSSIEEMIHDILDYYN